MGLSAGKLRAGTARGAIKSPELLRYEMVKLDELKPNRKNARKHSDRQIKQIARSMEQFGSISPIVVGPDYTIIAGHGRYAAAKLKGDVEVPVLVVEGLTAVQLKAYALADNKLGDLSSFDTKLLIEEIEGIITDSPEFDITVAGFVTAELDAMTGVIRTGDLNDLEDDPPPDPPHIPISREGDLWVLDDHQLACGDSTKPALIDELLGGEHARLMLSDVPFNLKIEGFASGLGRKGHSDFAMATGEMTYYQYVGFLRRSITACMGHLVDGAMVLLFIDWRHAAEMLDAGRTTGLELKNVLVWVKDNAGMGSLWRSQHELIVAFKHGSAPHVNNVQLGVHGRHRSNVLQYPGMNSMTKGRGKALTMHATVKPVALIADLILDVSDRGDIILDPFGGSGTAIIAAEKTGRRARLAEIDPGFVDVSVNRWQDLTGGTARLAATGQSFAEVGRDRLGDDLERQEAHRG
ncbi:site-specific DNA-methyltransferase [Parafrankia sp. BMG5.11]|uniref:site-specific DNA-methyltransferase n=1 Tax=Parafrankia sp. BMG5.11 TaxID=222540 RepID=UPI00103DB0C4|nr:DNA methyltransferase [Parafrankia sp. BMG5.11]TCJ41294.1 site-specific DNA-methyltransferase [Parafrankia sp. BMG5.11]